MKRVTLIVSGIMVLIVLVAIAIFAKLRSSTPKEDEAPATVVTVQTGILKLATLHQYVNAYGMIEPAPASTNIGNASVSLAAPSPGIVAEVNVVEGQPVAKGDVLVVLNSGTITAAFAEQELARQKKLFAQQNTSQRNLQNAEAQLASLRVIAPISGVATRVNAKVGQPVDVNTVVVEIIDLKRLILSAEIPAATQGLKLGEEVQLLAGTPMESVVSYLSPVVNQENDTVSMRVLVPPDAGLRVGQFVSFRIVTATNADCLAAPESAVVTSQTNHQPVLALVRGDEAQQTPVQTGLRENGLIEVSSPALHAGDTVVTVGAYGLPEHTKIVVQNPANESASTNSSEGQ